MNRVAFIFRHPPHGSSAGREALDAILATAALSDQIGVFFIGDGVFQLLSGQDPQAILSRDYTAAFGLLKIYDIEDIYLCNASLQQRGLAAYSHWAVPVSILDSQLLQHKLAGYDKIMTF